MIVAAHQPNHLPWLGFFDRMRRADVFVLVDHVQFERQNFQNRTRIRAGDGARWLTVPVFQVPKGERILDKHIDNHREGRLRWGRKAAMSLRYSYEAAPHYKELARELDAVYEARWNRLLELNLRLLSLCREALGIRTPMLRSSELRLSGLKSEMVLQLCRATGAKSYLAGNGGSREYLDPAALERAGVAVLWQEFRHPVYPQHPVNGSAFLPGLSVVDLLFNCGPRASGILRGDGQSQATAGSGATL